MPRIGADVLLQGRAAHAADDDERAVGIHRAPCIPPWIDNAG